MNATTPLEITFVPETALTRVKDGKLLTDPEMNALMNLVISLAETDNEVANSLLRAAEDLWAQDANNRIGRSATPPRALWYNPTVAPLHSKAKELVTRDLRGFVGSPATPQVPPLCVPIKEIEPAQAEATVVPPPEVAAATATIPATMDHEVFPFAGAIGHLKRIFKGGQTVCVRSIVYQGPVLYSRVGTLEQIATEAVMRELQAANERGGNVYVSMNPLREGAPSNQKIYTDSDNLVSAFLEIDENGEENLKKVRLAVKNGEVPKPHILLGSSPHKYQIIWRIDSATFTVAKVEAVTRSLAKMFGGDTQSVDVLRLLRIPDFENRKSFYLEDGKYPKVKTLRVSAHDRCKFEDFKIGVEVVKEKPAAPPASSSVLAWKQNQMEMYLREAGIDWGNENGGESSCSNYTWKEGTSNKDGEPLLMAMLDKCLYCGDHISGGERGGQILLFASGAIGGSCHHTGCKGRNWKCDAHGDETKGFRAAIERLLVATGKLPEGGRMNLISDEERAADAARVIVGESASAPVPVQTPDQYEHLGSLSLEEARKKFDRA